MLKLKTLLKKYIKEEIEYKVTSNVDSYRILFKNDVIWNKVWNILQNMFFNPKMAQLQKDIKTYDKDTKEITFRDSPSLQAFLSYLRKEKIIK